MCAISKQKLQTRCWSQAMLRKTSLMLVLHVQMVRLANQK